MASEKTLEKRLRETVKKAGGMAIKIYCLSFTGLPDRFVLMPGGRLWIVELKSTGMDCSPRQKIVIPQLLKLGFKVWVIDTEDLLQELIYEMIGEYSLSPKFLLSIFEQKYLKAA